MLLKPAIALKDGRLTDAAGTPAAGDVLQLAAAWTAAGAGRLHITDRDVGNAGKRAGVEVIRELVRTHSGVPVQVAGDFRSEDDVERYLGAGVEYVLLEMRAAGTPHLVSDLCFAYPGHILMSLESRAGKPVPGGGSRAARRPLAESARRFQQEGVAAILFHAAADAAGRYDHAPALELAALVAIPVLASAGLVTPVDVAEFCGAAEGLAGAVLEPAYPVEPRGFAALLQAAERVAGPE
ncbi:MAG: HisA/HisF-related TIM barrel protein [Gammaproteobacteria bacterium]